MSSWSDEVNQLVSETNLFIDAAESKTGILDGYVTTANTIANSALVYAANSAVSAVNARSSADRARGEAFTTEAIANFTAAQRDAISQTERQVSLTSGLLANTAITTQDLSGINAAALHRSPNAITSMFIYDTSKDSDGGAWTEKCQHTSWWNEAINGKWLGAVGSELMARAQGATLGPNTVANPTLDANATGFTTFGGATIISEGGRGRLIGSGTQFCGVFADFTDPASMTTNVLYEMSFDLYAGTYTGAVGISADGQDPIASYASVQSGFTRYTAYIAPGVFTNSSNGKRLRIRFESTHTAGQFVFIDNVSYRRVTALTTVSGDYYQSATDGRFYRLWRNYLGATESLSDAFWSKTLNGLFIGGGTGSRTVTDAYAAAHDGQVIASRVQESASNDVQGIIPATTASSTLLGLDHVFTIDLKADTRTQAFVGHVWESGVTGTGQGSWIVIDLTNGTQIAKKDGLGNADSSLVSCVSLGNGWWRATVRLINITNATLLRPIFGPASGGVGVYQGDGTSGILVARPHVQIGTTEAVYEKKTVAEGSVGETFRGNKRDFPRLAGIVAEASNVTIYDLTESGRPMWMRFFASTNYTTFLNWASNAGSMTGLAGVNAKLMLLSTGGSLLLDFVKDDALCLSNGTGRYLPKRQIADRQSSGGYVASGGDGLQLANPAVNAVAMTVLPGAPVDPVTGLRVPTIAVATGSSLDVIKSDGKVVSTNIPTLYGTNTTHPMFLQYGSILALRGGSSGQWLTFGLSDQNDTTPSTAGAFPKVTDALFKGKMIKTGPLSTALVRAPWNSDDKKGRVILTRYKDPNFATGLQADVSPFYNTGWMTGDIRRCFLSDTEVGALTGPELVTNGDFSNGTTGWTVPAGASVVDGQLSITANSAADVVATTSINVVAGKTYVLTFDKISGAAGFGDPAWALVFGVPGLSLVQGLSGLLPAGRHQLFFTSNITGAAQLSVGNYADGSQAPGGTQTVVVDNISVREAVADRSYRARGASIAGTLTRAQLASGSSLVSYSGWSAANYLREPYSADLDFGTGEWTGSAWVNIPASVSAGIIFDRAAASGAPIRLGITATGQLTATASDGTTTRTVTTSAAYNTGQWIKAGVDYTTDGSLSILVNGREVAITRGAPLLTLNNSSATLTIGNSFALDTPFPGSIALLKLSATVATTEQEIFMYEQEKQLFRENSQCVLPDANEIADMAYDDATDRWVAISSTNESYWNGLVRNSVTPVPAGSYTRVVASSGLELAARSTTNPGVDVTIPTYMLREDLNKRSESTSKTFKELVTFDYIGGFTGNTTTGSTAITSVANITYPTSYIGARIFGSGIPTNAFITGVSGTTIYISAPATATTTNISVNFLDFRLPLGFETEAVASAGTVRREGSTADYTRLYDGFIETIRFATAPGSTTWVQIQASRQIT